MQLHGQVAIVTGGASGIGRAVATRFARDGAKVSVADRSIDGARAVAAEIAASGGTAIAVGVDVTVEAEVQALAHETRDAFGPVNVWMSNAGIAATSDLYTTDAVWRAAWEVHVMSH